ncbi:hypothetical protein I4U23_031163 [Adineta vaga]|nr:hypothetical protein I4U23_031163 [Adineta vaga]
MFTSTGLYVMLFTLTCLVLFNSVFTMPTDVEEQDQKRSIGNLFEQSGMDHDYVVVNQPNNDNDNDNHVVFQKRREMKRKWAKFFQGADSPYAIAFPALIRSRR